MTARAQMEQVKLQELSLKNMKSTEDESITYVLIQSFIKQLPSVVYFMPLIKVVNYNCDLTAIILQFMSSLDDVTSWNIRLLFHALLKMLRFYWDTWYNFVLSYKIYPNLYIRP